MELGRRPPRSLTRLSAKPTHSRVVSLGDSLLLVGIGGKYPELCLLRCVKLLSDAGEACLPLTARGCPGGSCRKLLPQIWRPRCRLGKQPYLHLDHSRCLGPRGSPSLRGLTSTSWAPAPSSSKHWQSSVAVGHGRGGGGVKATGSGAFPTPGFCPYSRRRNDACLYPKKPTYLAPASPNNW